jgi:ribosomal-protein-alanine N-acetyltransferase
MIRLANENDILRILEIEREAISPPWSQEALLSEIRKADSYFVVAVAASHAISGFAILREVGNDGELLQIAVDGNAQRRGIGDSLMGAVLDFAKDNTFESVFLEVRSSNKAAVRLYEKHGFKPVRTRKGYYDNPVEDALVMVREVLLLTTGCGI